LTPSTQLSVRVFNRAEDKDEDAVFGAKAHIAFDLQSAWVKYKIAVKADAKLALGTVAANGSIGLELSDYRIHDATDGAFTAMRADLSAPRTLLSLDDVRSLKPGEALMMEIGGSLATSVTFAWSDVIASKLGEIVQELVPRMPLAVKMKAGAEVTAKVKVSDQFSVVISRTRDGHFRIAVKKAKSRDHTLGIEVSFDVELSAVPAIDDALDAIVAAIGPEGKREEAAAEQLRDQLRDKLVDAARWKAATGFTYEYARIDENTSIADFILLDESLLASDYELAMSGDFAALSDALRRDSASRTLVRYLNETTLTRRSSSGFSLGISKWIAVETEDSSAFKLTTRESLDGFQLLTARGTRRYEEKLLTQNDYEWTIDVKAQMSEFRIAPTSLDFDYGLHIAVLLERNELDAEDLQRMLDFAAMWDVCVPEPALYADAIDRKGSIRLQMIFERDALIATLGACRETLDDWAEPLAMAMPYSDRFADRRSFASRREIYTEAWQRWLAEQPFDATTLLRSRIHSGLVLLEERALPGSFAWISGDGHPQLRTRLASFLRGARQLCTAMTTAQEPQAIGDAYDAMSQFWTQRLYIAACGRYLLDRAAQVGTQPNVTLQVEFADGTITS
jgi:hypothetical protein